MAFITIEDLTGVVEMMVPAKVYAESEVAFKSDLPLVVNANVSLDRDEDGNQRLRVRATGAKLIADVRRERTRAVVLAVEEGAIAPNNLSELKVIFGEFEGSCPVKMVVKVPQTANVEMDLPAHLNVDPSDGLIDRVEQLFGQGVVRLA